jgi:hypothetical protein
MRRPASEKASQNAASQKAWKDLYSSLGTTWRFYNSPGEGGLIFTGITVVLDVEDQARFDAAVDKLAFVAQASGFHFHEFEFHGRAIRYAAGSAMNNEITFPIAWMFDDGRMIAAISPQILKAHIRRQDAAKLVDTAEVKDLLSRSDGTLFMSYVDAPSLYRLTYSGGLAMVPFIGAGLDMANIEYPIHEIPSFAAISPYLHPEVTSMRPEKNGFQTESHRSLPFSGGIVWAYFLVGFASQFGIGMQQGPMPAIALEPGPLRLVPALPAPALEQAIR